MTVAERLHGWNQWYDGLPQEWRFQLILWPLIVLGVINMLLSLSVGFSFGLLVLLGMLFVAAVRVPYILGWVTPDHALPSGEPGAPRLAIGGAGADWIAGLNERYDAVPERSRFFIFPAILLIAGAVNMELTINQAWPFGLLFLIVLLAIVVVRAPYVHGMLRAPSAAGDPAPALQYNARIADERPTSEAVRPGEPAVAAPVRHDGPAAVGRQAAPAAPPRPEPAPDLRETDAMHPPSAAPPRPKLGPELDEAEALPPPAPKHPPDHSPTE
jgi:hypothetical protein